MLFYESQNGGDAGTNKAVTRGVDSFSNNAAGGIIPGIQLTSLCGDD